MLAVRNIPGELNTITHLNGHFSRYGNLVNVQVWTGSCFDLILLIFLNRCILKETQALLWSLILGQRRLMLPTAPVRLS